VPLRLAGVLALAVTLGCTEPPPERPPAPRSSVPRQPLVRDCPPGPVENFMAAQAQQCWYAAPKGRWRIRNHEFHYDVLVMDTVASNLEMAEEVTRRLAEVHGERFQEILIYVELEDWPSPTPVRRVRWTRTAPPEVFDFSR
jgi:hypothetical protein